VSVGRSGASVGAPAAAGAADGAVVPNAASDGINDLFSRVVVGAKEKRLAKTVKVSASRITCSDLLVANLSRLFAESN
jgi:hypothetical protein